MKQSFSILFLFIVTIYNLNAQKVMSSSRFAKVMYVGVQNPISILSDKIPAKEISVEAPYCIIKKSTEKDNQYFFEPTKSGSLKLSYKHKGKVIGVDTYIVKSMPQAVAYFGRDNNEKGSMSIGEMKAQGGIACRQECCGFKMKYLTTCFRFRIFRNDGKLMLDKIVENENYFSPATNQLLETIQPGDEILFSEIKYQDVEIDEKGKNIIRSVANPYIRIKIR